MNHLHDSGPNAHGVGVSEEQLHVATGLRTQTITATIERNLSGIVSSSATPIGTLTGAASGTWGAGLRSFSSAWNPHMPYPMTPLITFFVNDAAPAVFPQTVYVRIRMTGTDQFGNRIVEVSPWLSKTMTTTSQLFVVCMSKVFATIDDCWIQTDNVKFDDIASLSQVGIGWGCLIDPTGLAAAAFADTPGFNILWGLQGGVTTNVDVLGTEKNWGLGTPMRVSPYGPDIPYASPEVLGATAELIRNLSSGALLSEIARLPVLGQQSAGALPDTGIAVGRSSPGWQGTPHKVGFFSNDGWTTKITGITLTASSTRASDIPTAFLDIFEDTMRFTMHLRTTLGTSRGDNATSTYPRG